MTKYSLDMISIICKYGIDDENICFGHCYPVVLWKGWRSKVSEHTVHDTWRNLNGFIMQYMNHALIDFNRH